MQKLVFRNPNGEEIDFTGGDFGVTKWEGFSHVDMDVQSQQVPFNDGSVFLDALLSERELNVTVAINDDGDLEKRYRLKRELIHCLNPKLGEGELIYTNDYTSKKIVCVPAIPEFENKNINDRGSQKASCTFNASNPYWEDVEETSIAFSLSDNININNTGDFPCPLKIELYGNEVKNPVLKNITTRKKVALTGEYTGAISYNFNTGKKSIILGALTQELKVLDRYSGDYTTYYPSIAEGNGIIVISGMTSYYSYDGYNYNIIENLATNGEYDVSLANVYYSPNHNCFFATKVTDGVYSSQDGKTWQKISNEAVGRIVGIDNVLLGWIIDSNEIKKSVDGGVTWTVAQTAVNNITDIETSDSLILVSSPGGGYISTDLGETWTQASISGPLTWIKESNAFFRITGNGTTERSVDGITWTQVFNYRLDIIYNPIEEKLYGISSNSKTYVSSDDGETWSLYGEAFITGAELIWSIYAGRAIGVKENCLRLSYNMQEYEEIYFPSNADIAVIEDKKIILGTHYYYKDGEWHYISQQLPNAYDSKCCYGNGVYIRKQKSSYGVYIYYSTDDCETWNSQRVSDDLQTYKIAYSKGLGKFFCGQYSSTDGVNWTKTTEESVSNIFTVDTPNGSWLYAQPTGYGHYYLKSTDGITWVETGAYGGAYFVCYCDKQNLVYLVGAYMNQINKIYVNKPDTEIYTEREFFGEDKLSNLSWSSELNLFIAVGGVSAGQGYSKCHIYTSVDGMNWERFPASTICHFIYAGFLKSFIGTEGATLYFEGMENIIDAVSEDSDLNFTLDYGVNQIRWSVDKGYGSGIISYTQKYLGV